MNLVLNLRANRLLSLIRLKNHTPVVTMATNSSNNSRKEIKTAILMMNMGGPESDKVEDVQKFLGNLFKDRDIIKMPMQGFLGPIISKRRAPNLKAKFDQIGGDPLKDWSERQGRVIVEILDKTSPATAPHKAYTCFRYSKPDIEVAVQELEEDKAQNVVLLSKYPQYSCSTTGSNLNEIAKYCCEVKQHLNEKPKQRWSLIDRWPVSSAIVDAYADLIEQELAKLSEQLKKEVIILFSAHSIPTWMVERGDDYTGEVGGTVQAVMAKLRRKNAYSLVWQSKVGPVQWQGPAIEKAIEGYVNNGHKHFMIVPIAFVNEHVETLHELDIEYAKELKEKIPFETFARVPALNEHPKFFEGVADLIKEHLESKETISAQMRRRCPGCTKDNCKQTRTWLARLDSINSELAD